MAGIRRPASSRCISLASSTTYWRTIFSSTKIICTKKPLDDLRYLSINSCSLAVALTESFSTVLSGSIIARYTLASRRKFASGPSAPNHRFSSSSTLCVTLLSLQVSEKLSGYGPSDHDSSEECHCRMQEAKADQNCRTRGKDISR